MNTSVEDLRTYAEFSMDISTNVPMEARRLPWRFTLKPKDGHDWHRPRFKNRVLKKYHNSLYT